MLTRGGGSQLVALSGVQLASCFFWAMVLVAVTFLPLSALAVTLYGTSGNDTLIGTSGTDLIYGNSGNDWIDGKGGAEKGGHGTGGLYGGFGADEIYGGDGMDGLNDHTNPGDCDGYTDYLVGQAQSDTLVAYGCYQKDYFYGGSGTDVCHLDYADVYNSCEWTYWY